MLLIKNSEVMNKYIVVSEASHFTQSYFPCSPSKHMLAISMEMSLTDLCIILRLQVTVPISHALQCSYWDANLVRTRSAAVGVSNQVLLAVWLLLVYAGYRNINTTLNSY